MNLRSWALLGSFLFLGDSYLRYSAAKWIYRRGFGRGIAYRLPSYPKNGLVVEGFAHSANCFIRNNLPREMDTDTSSFHRTWAIRRAIKHGARVAILIRDPLEVAKSWHYRSLSHPDGVYPVWVVLICWTIYYTRAWKFRRRALLIDFGDAVHDYSSVRRRILEYCSVPLAERPNENNINTFEGERFPIKLSWADKAFLYFANCVYRKYKNFKSDHRQIPSVPDPSR